MFTKKMYGIINLIGKAKNNILKNTIRIYFSLISCQDWIRISNVMAPGDGKVKLTESEYFWKISHGVSMSARYDAFVV